MVPSIINAGETLKFSLTLTDYKASEWNLSFTLLNASLTFSKQDELFTNFSTVFNLSSIFFLSINGFRIQE